MFLLIRRDTTISRCKSHFPILTALFTEGALRREGSGKGRGLGRPLSPTLALGPAPSVLPPPTPICMHGCSGHFKKKKGILCTIGQTRLENYLQILKASSHIYSRVFIEVCLTENCPSRCHREICTTIARKKIPGLLCDYTIMLGKYIRETTPQYMKYTIVREPTDHTLLLWRASWF